MEWPDKKVVIIDALTKHGYSDEKQKDVFQLVDPNNPMIPTVNLQKPPEDGINIIVYFENTDDPDIEYTDDVNGQLGAAKQIIRNAMNSQKETKPIKPTSESKKDKNILDTKSSNIEKNLEMIKEHNKNVPAKPTNRNGKVASWAENMTDAEIDRVIERKKTEKALQGGKFYSADGGSQVPDAKAIQEIANDAGIDSEILEAVQTDDYVHVKVRSYMGKHYTEAVVHLDFKIEKNLKIIEIIGKNQHILERFDSAEPIIKSDAQIRIGDKQVNAQLHIIKTILRYMKFSMRAATTTAMSNTYKKLLNQEWREKEEIQMEYDERDQVQEDIQTNNVMQR